MKQKFDSYEDGVRSGNRIVLLLGMIIAVFMLSMVFVSAVSITDDLEAYYKLDETTGTTALDYIGSNDGTMTGYTFNDGNIWGDVNTDNDVINFDGTGDYVDTGLADLNSDITLSAWAKISSAAGSTVKGIVGIRDSVGNNRIYIGFVGGQTAPVFSIGNPSINITGGSIGLDTWALITATYNNTTGAMELFVNGTSVGTQTSSRTDSGLNYFIGAVNNAGTPTSGTYLNGGVDDVQVYSRVLSSDEITAQYNEGRGSYALSGDGLVAQYSGRDYNATHILDSNPVVEGATNNTVYGKTFDGTNDYISLGTQNDVNDEATWSFWVKRNSNVGYAGLIGKYNTSGNQRSFGIGTSSGGTTIKMLLSSNGTTTGIFDNSPVEMVYDINTWTLVTISYSGGNYVKFYQNGEFKKEYTDDIPSNVFPSTADLRLAYTQTTFGKFNGSLDEVGIWSRALSEDEITYLYETSPYAEELYMNDYGANAGVLVWTNEAYFRFVADKNMLVYTIQAEAYTNGVEDLVKIYSDNSGSLGDFITSGTWVGGIGVDNNSSLDTPFFALDGNQYWVGFTDNDNGIRVQSADVVPSFYFYAGTLFNRYLFNYPASPTYGNFGASAVKVKLFGNNDFLVADFNYVENPSLSTISFYDQSISYVGTVNDWNWLVNSVKQSDLQNFDYSVSQNEDLNVCLFVSNTNGDTNSTCQNITALDSVYPTIDANITFSKGFGEAQDLNYNMTCYDNATPINYLIEWLDVNGSTIELYNSDDANATLVSDTYVFGNNNGRVRFTCTDQSDNATSYTSIYAYGVNLYFVNEKNGSLITSSDIDDLNIVKVETINGLYFYDFKAEGTQSVGFTSDADTLIFEFQYKDALDTIIKREINFSFIDDTNIPICLAPFEQLYIQRFISSRNDTEVIVYNDQSACYNLVSKTQYIFETTNGVQGYTIAKPYSLSTINDDGETTLLSYLDGDSSLQHNLDAIVYSQETFIARIGEDSVAYKCLMNNVTDACDLNTLIIYFKAKDTNNQSVNFSIYLDGTQLYNYTEFANPDEFNINWFYGGVSGLTDQNVLRLQVEIVDADGETRRFSSYFDINGYKRANSTHQILGFVLGVMVILFGLTLVKSQEALGWFGIIVCIIGLAITSVAVATWWVTLLQAAIVVIIIYIFFITKGSVRPGEIA